MSTVLAIAFVLFMYFIGIYFTIIAFGIRKPKFKDDEKERRFTEKYKKHHLLLKVAAILFLVFFTVELVRSGMFERMLSQ